MEDRKIVEPAHLHNMAIVAHLETRDAIVAYREAAEKLRRPSGDSEASITRRRELRRSLYEARKVLRGAGRSDLITLLATENRLIEALQGERSRPVRRALTAQIDQVRASIEALTP